MKLTLYTARPAAGFPAPTDDYSDGQLDLNDLLIDNPHSTFFVKVEGDSMEGAKIFSGDILVVDRAPSPKHNSIVVAAVFGEMVVKRLMVGRDGTFLVSENKTYSPIKLNEAEDCFIWGVVTGLVRVL